MLHITNGDSAVAVLERTGVEGEIVAWRDVLHEGPVPAGLSLEELSDVRAAFIEAQGPAWCESGTVRAQFAARDAALARGLEHDEVVLWFEHDLYDQLQLVQLLDWFATSGRPARLSLVCEAEYLGMMAPERAAELFAARGAVTPRQLELARAAWGAFRSTDPTEIETTVAAGTSELPFLGPALLRHLEQFPAVGTGLSRSEQQALTTIGEGQPRIRDVYRASHSEMEDPIFLGDSTFAWYMEALATGEAPLVTLGDGELPLERTVALTRAGMAVLAGSGDRIALNGIDRWLGGVHLSGRSVAWRWDPATRSLVGSTDG